MFNATVLVAVITAFAAIIAPVVTSVINSRTSMKLKQLELFEASVNICICDLAKSYSELADSQWNMQHYWDFVTASYKAIAQIPDYTIQANILDLLDSIRNNNGASNEDTDQHFNSIMLRVSNYLAESRK